GPGLADRASVEQHTQGADEFLRAAASWSPEAAEKICGVPASEIIAAAEELGVSRPAYFRVGWGLERNRNGGSACAAAFALPLLTGQFGVLGSGIFASLSEAAPLTTGPHDPAERRPPPLRHIHMNRPRPMP